MGGVEIFDLSNAFLNGWCISYNKSCRGEPLARNLRTRCDCEPRTLVGWPRYDGQLERASVPWPDIGTGPFQAVYDLKACADDKTIVLDGKSVKAVHKRWFKLGMKCGKCM